MATWDLEDIDCRSYSKGKRISSTGFSCRGVENFKIRFYPRGTKKSNGFPAVELAGPNVLVKAAISLDGIALGTTSWVNLKFGRLKMESKNKCKARYREISVEINAACTPVLTWELATDDVRCAEKGTSIESPPFSVGGLEGMLSVDFYPAGGLLSKDGKASAYVRSAAPSDQRMPAGLVLSRLSLHVDGVTRTLVDIRNLDSVGWANFMNRRPKYKHMYVFNGASGSPDDSEDHEHDNYIGCQIYMSHNSREKLSLLDEALRTADTESLLRALPVLAADSSVQVARRASDLLCGLRASASLLRSHTQLRARAEAATGSRPATSCGRITFSSAVKSGSRWWNW